MATALSNKRIVSKRAPIILNFYIQCKMNNDQIRQPKLSIYQESPQRRPTMESSKTMAIRLLKQLTQAQRTKKIQQLQQKIHTLAEINNLIEQAIKKNQPQLGMFTQDKLIIYIRYYFIENVSKIQSLKYLRLIMLNENVCKKYLKHNLPVYIARVLQREQNRAKQQVQQQILEALRLMNEWICKFPQSFPKYLAGTLVAYAQLPTQISIGFEEKKKQFYIPLQAKRFAIETVMYLAINNTQLCCYSGGFGLLSNAILDSNIMDQGSDLMCNLLYFINQEKNRQIVIKYMDLRKAFYVFTDLDYVLTEQTYKFKGGIQGLTKLQNQLNVAKAVILSMLKSWTGLIYLGNQKTALRSFLQALKQIPKTQQSQIRKIIFSVLQEILSIGDSFLSNSRSLQQNKFRAVSLINCYLMTIIQLLIENNLFKILIELSSVEQGLVTESAQKLLKKLTILIFNFFPESSRYIDFLITAAITTQSSRNILKSSSSFMLTKIGNYIYDKKKPNPHRLLGKFQNLFHQHHVYMSFSKSSTLSIMQSINFINHRQSPSYRKTLLDKNIIPKDHKQNHKKWEWPLIEEFLVFPDSQKMNYKPDSNQKYKESKLFKYLFRFYSPSRARFINEKWSDETFQYIKVGQLIIKNSLTIPQYSSFIRNPPQSQFQCTISFVAEIQKLLENVLVRISSNPNQFYTPFYKQYERELLMWIGLFSHNNSGYQSLLCQNNFFQILYSLLDNPSCASVIGSIMYHFDYYRDNMLKKLKDNIKKGFNFKEDRLVIGPRALLERCIHQGSLFLILDCIQIIKMLFHSQLASFVSEGLGLLLRLLVKDNKRIVLMSLQLLQELLQNKNICSQFLVLLKNDKDIVKYQKILTINVIIRFLCLQQGIEFVNQYFPDWLKQQYFNWVEKSSSYSYCLKLQQLLDNSLNFTKKEYVGFRITSEKPYLQLLYIYKLPWILYVNNDQYPLHVRYKNNKFILYAPLCLKVDKSHVEIGVGVGAMFVDQFLNESTINYVSRVIMESEEEVQFYDGQFIYKTVNSGITVWFKIITDNNNNVISYQIIEIEVEINVYSNQQNEQLPLHLIRELSKTKEGIKFLQSKNFLNYSSQRLKESQSALQIRSMLWGIGYFGSTEQGIIHVIDSGILKDIIEMSLKCKTLSLRGTSRYVLNMFCHTQKGRQFIQNNSYVVNKRCLACSPKESSDFFHYQTSHRIHYSMQEQYWKNCILLPINQGQQKLLNCIQNLINNHLSMKSATIQIRQILKMNNRITHSTNLFNNVIQLLTFHKLRYDGRKVILSIFEDWIKSPQFNVQIESKIHYFTI